MSARLRRCRGAPSAVGGCRNVAASPRRGRPLDGRARSVCSLTSFGIADARCACRSQSRRYRAQRGATKLLLRRRWAAPNAHRRRLTTCGGASIGGERAAAAASAHERAIEGRTRARLALKSTQRTASDCHRSSSRAEALRPHLTPRRALRRVPADDLNRRRAPARGAASTRPSPTLALRLKSRDDTLGRMVHLMQLTCDWRGRQGTAWGALRASLRRAARPSKRS